MVRRHLTSYSRAFSTICRLDSFARIFAGRRQECSKRALRRRHVPDPRNGLIRLRCMPPIYRLGQHLGLGGMGRSPNTSTQRSTVGFLKSRVHASKYAGGRSTYEWHGTWLRGCWLGRDELRYGTGDTGVWQRAAATGGVTSNYEFGLARCAVSTCHELRYTAQAGHVSPFPVRHGKPL